MMLRPMPRLTRALVMLSLFTLGGCASLPETRTVSDAEVVTDDMAQRTALWQKRQGEIQKLNTWRSEGRAAIIAQNGGGQISFDWLYSPKNQVLNIKTPLGQNAMQLTINPGGATLIDHEGQVTQGDDGEAMLNEVLGWSVPFESLRAWLLGLPATEDDSYTLDTQGRLLTLDSQGWSIEYKRYRNMNNLGTNISLPSKFELRRSEMTLRLVIDRWTL